jgi:hypothetical protein
VRSLVLAAALACAAAAAADTPPADVDPRSAADRHWLVYCGIRPAQ